MHNLAIHILLVASFAYILEILLLRIGLGKANRFAKKSDFEPTVSIIVAARNEERQIEQCLSSLLQLDYPRDKLEIIIVNDLSNDRTPAIIEEYVRRHGCVKMVTTLPEEGNLRGKTNAVAAGIDASHGEILMFTDADCVVRQEWVSETVRSFDERVGIVGGFTLLDIHNAFEGMQALDWVYLFGISSASAGWRIPLTAIGNNLSVRRSAYDATGGYRRIPFSVTEDYSLVRAILSRTSYELRFPSNTKTVVKSAACQNWKKLFRQKQRWGVGGLDMVPRGFVIMSIGWFLKMTLILGLFFVPVTVWLSAFCCKSFVDYLFVRKPLKQLGSLSALRYFFFFEIYFTVYVAVLPFVALLSKNVVWKERKL